MCLVIRKSTIGMESITTNGRLTFTQKKHTKWNRKIHVIISSKKQNGSRGFTVHSFVLFCFKAHDFDETDYYQGI